MTTEQAHRRQGLARAVVTAGLGAEIVDLQATPGAIALYRSLAFTEPKVAVVAPGPAG